MFTLVLIGLSLLVAAVKLFHWLQARKTISSLHTRYVLITGCDTGFGRRLALRLDSMGCHVFAACLTSAGAKDLSSVTSERVKTIQMDVTNDDDIERAVKEVQAALPDKKGLWAIVNNAGIFGSYGAAEMMTRKEFLAPLQVNLLGMTQVTRNFLFLVRRERGRIVNTTSIVGRVALSPCPYIASKFAAVGYTDMLRRELYHHGISVHSIEPGAYVNTALLSEDLARQSLDRVFNAAPPHVQRAYGDQFVDKTVEVLGGLLRDLCSDNPEDVVDANVHALTSRRPSLSYVVGRNGNWFFWPLSIIPTAWTDFIVSLQAIRPPRLEEE